MLQIFCLIRPYFWTRPSHRIRPFFCIFDAMLTTSQGVHDIALEKQDFPSKDGPYPTERRIVASNGGYVKPQPTGQIRRADTPPQMFFEIC